MIHKDRLEENKTQKKLHESFAKSIVCGNELSQKEKDRWPSERRRKRSLSDHSAHGLKISDSDTSRIATMVTE